MLKKMPIKLRLTVLSMLLLTLCCVGLTTILNLSANRMANTIEATLMTPARTIGREAPPRAGAEQAVSERAVSGQAALVSLDQAQVARVAFLNESIAAMILFVVLGGGLTYFISGRALRPLKDLSGQMKNRTVHNLSEKLPVPESRDEIAELTCAFNEMSAKLEAAFAMQKRFSQSAAHELRTPLTVIKTKVEVFGKRQAPTPAEYGHLLSTILPHIDRLAELIKDLLNLTNMDAINCDEPINLMALLGDVAAELSGLAQEKGIRVTVAGETLDIQGNASLLHRAFYNLVENAIKYNRDGGEVEIQLSCAAGKRVIAVSDGGIGIAQSARALIFEPFYRVDKSRSRQMGGAGLGLSTVKAIIEKHHGSITVSERPTGGTVLTVTL
ncbi:MAG: HAMP domain-containing sensor histidine kinase [Clostridia bacterium]